MDLDELMAKEKFRKDLYYRLAEIKVELPALKERMEDIPLLIENTIAEYCSEHEITECPRPEPDFIKACLSYDWPGNIRELENAVRVATALAERNNISLNFLPENHFLKRLVPARNSTELASSKDKNLPLLDRHNRFDPHYKWRDYEAQIIAAAYKKCKFNAKSTAENLGLAIATVYKKVSEFALKDKSNPLFATAFKYEPHFSLDSYIVKIFKAAWEYEEKSPYRAARILGVSSGYFYKIMKKFAK
jgi:DNA-binding NtrC family response regulator